jgi:hypothetical protein
VWLSGSRGGWSNAARMDADDVALPDRLLRQVAYLDAHPECLAVGTGALFIDPEDWFIAQGPVSLTWVEDNCLPPDKGGENSPQARSREPDDATFSLASSVGLAHHQPVELSKSSMSPVELASAYHYCCRAKRLDSCAPRGADAIRSVFFEAGLGPERPLVLAEPLV